MCLCLRERDIHVYSYFRIDCAMSQCEDGKKTENAERQHPYFFCFLAFFSLFLPRTHEIVYIVRNTVEACGKEKNR